MAGRNVVVSLTANVSGFKSAMAQASASATSLASKTQAAVSKNQVALNGMSNVAGGIGVALALGIGAAVRSAANFDQAMSSVAATGADAKANIDALRQAAIDAGASTSFSATEAAAGLESLSKAGVSAKDSLGGGLKGALDLAAAGQIGVGEAAETAATAMTQFGLAGKDVPHIADLIAAGAGKAQGEVGDMAAALKQSGLVAAQFGLSIEDTTGSLAAFASAGLIGSDAGTSLKTMLISLANPSKESAAKMKELGIAAYDAQGNFVGVTDLAEQLKTKMTNLKPAVRDAALAQIFGNDAIRAANVLYEQGGEGIAGWIANVNDAGFAAETAATKLDNLKGDLEAMSGAFETAMIGLGEGANGPLRGLVQGATDAINAFNELSSGTKGAVLIVGASLAALALGAAGVIKTVIAINSARTALAGLSLAAPGAAAGLRGVAAAAGPVGLALLAVSAATTTLNQLGQQAGNIDEVTRALTDLSKATGATATEQSALTSAFGQMNWADQLMTAITGTQAPVDDLNVALRRVSSDGMTGFANKFNDIREGLIPGQQGFERMNAGIKGVDDSLAQMVASGNAEQAAAAFKQIAENSGVDPAKLMNIFTGYGDALGNMATQAEDAASSTSTLTPALSAADAALAGMQQASSDAAQSLDDMINNLFGAANAALALSGNQIAFEASIDAATASIKENGKTLNVNTEKGRANKQALDNIASSSLTYISSLIEQGKSTKTVTKATADAREAFIAAAKASGKSSEAAEKMANKYGLVPKKVRTDVSAPGAKEAKSDADKLDAALKGLDPVTKTRVTSAFDRGGIDAARRELAAINGKTATTYIQTVNRGTVTARADAAGGYITGPGNSISDSIPAWLSNGEYVLRAAAVQAIGISELHRLNSLGGPQRAFAGGGLVGVGATGFAAGGPVSASEFGRSNQFSVAAIVALIRAIQNPVRDLTSATKAFAAAQAAANAAAKTGRAPKGRLDAATDRYEAARDKRDAERAKNAAALAKQKERVAKAQKEYDRLDKAGDKTKGRTAADIRAEKAKAELDRARDRRDKISRANTAEMARLNARVTATSKDKTKAQADYNVYADRAKVATDRLKDAQKNLADQQKAVADSARQVSETFAGKYQSGSTDAKDWLESKKNGAADLIKFNAQIMALRKVGLNETDIQAIINQPGGGTVAQQIINGGTNLVKSLNAAQQKLQDAADKLGFNAATGVGRYATGGPVFGSGTATSDSISARLSNGEYVVNAAATAANREVLDAMNYGRRVIDRNYVQAYAYGGYVRREPAGASPALIAAAVRAGLEGARLEGHINGDYIEARVRSHLTTVGSNAQYRRLTR